MVRKGQISLMDRYISASEQYRLYKLRERARPYGLAIILQVHEHVHGFDGVTVRVSDTRPRKSVFIMQDTHAETKVALDCVAACVTGAIYGFERSLER